MTIKVENYSKTIKKNQVLKNINATFESGKIYGLIGHNGSGKTMLLRAITGLICPTKGKIYLDNKEMFKDFDIMPDVGIIINNQEMIPSLTAKENMEYLRKINLKVQPERILEVLKRVGLERQINNKVKNFSLGMKQRLNIAQAIFEDQKVILLDEPTNAIDSEGIIDILELLKELKSEDKIIIIATHDTGYFKEVFDEIIKLKEGELVEVS